MRRRPATHGRMARARDGERGAALLMSIVLVTVCATLGAAFSTLAAANARAQSHAVAQLKAFYAAEAGLAEAFVAVRMGRSGNIATSEEPAAFGNCEVFVRAFEDDEHRVHLLAKGLYGRSEAILGQVVLPPEPPLGFFAIEDLVIEGRVFVDGFNADRQSYDAEVDDLQSDRAASQEWSDDQLGTFESAREAVAPIVDSMGERATRQVLEEQVESDPAGGTTLVHDPIDPRDHLDSEDYSALLANLEDLAYTHAAGMLFVEESGGLLGGGGLLGTGLLAGDDPEDPEDPEPLTHTLHGGHLGSNGDVVFTEGAAGSEIHGSVTPGPDDAVTGTAYAEITGSTLPRTEAAAPTEVFSPNYASNGNLTPGGFVPEVIESQRVRYDTVRVTSGQELELRGPVELVAANLFVESGGRLTLDTSDGHIVIILGGSMDLDGGSIVVSNATRSEEVSIQAVGHAALATEVVLAAPVQFHGTIKAPRSHVRVASAFEVFGAITARTLTLADGVRLHFDSATYDGGLELPRPDSWRIISLPSKETADQPAAVAGRDRIADSPKRDDTIIAIHFIDTAGSERIYKGPESVLDYALVDRVIYVERYLDSGSTRDAAPDDITVGNILDATLDLIGL